MAKRPIPETFPEGTVFYDMEDAPYVEVPGEGWFNCFLNDFDPRGTSMPDSVMRNGIRVDEAEFRRLVRASIGER